MKDIIKLAFLTITSSILLFLFGLIPKFVVNFYSFGRFPSFSVKGIIFNIILSFVIIITIYIPIYYRHWNEYLDKKAMSKKDDNDI